RDFHVTGVQTCALPILWSPDFPPYHRSDTATVQPTPERKGSDIEARRQALMAQGRGFWVRCTLKAARLPDVGSCPPETRRKHIPVGSLMTSLSSNGLR